MNIPKHDDPSYVMVVMLPVTLLIFVFCICFWMYMLLQVAGFTNSAVPISTSFSAFEAAKVVK